MAKTRKFKMYVKTNSFVGKSGKKQYFSTASANIAGKWYKVKVPSSEPIQLADLTDGYYDVVSDNLSVAKATKTYINKEGKEVLENDTIWVRAGNFTRSEQTAEEKDEKREAALDAVFDGADELPF